MKKVKKWLSEHECVRRALRTFVQAATGVLTAALTNAAGIVENVNTEAVIVLAVATGLSAVMNMGEEKES